MRDTVLRRAPDPEPEPEPEGGQKREEHDAMPGRRAGDTTFPPHRPVSVSLPYGRRATDRDVTLTKRRRTKLQGTASAT
jgi:hypothetical protein